MVAHTPCCCFWGGHGTKPPASFTQPPPQFCYFAYRCVTSLTSVGSSRYPSFSAVWCFSFLSKSRLLCLGLLLGRIFVSDALSSPPPFFEKCYLVAIPLTNTSTPPPPPPSPPSAWNTHTRRGPAQTLETHQARWETTLRPSPSVTIPSNPLLQAATSPARSWKQQKSSAGERLLFHFPTPSRGRYLAAVHLSYTWFTTKRMTSDSPAFIHTY